MPKVVMHDAGEANWLLASEHAPAEVMAHITEEERATEVNVHHPGSAEHPQLVEIRMPPNTKIRSHAHDSDEIMYILEGEVKLGARRFGPGSSIFVEGRTFYAFQVGEGGLRYLNFRRSGGFSYIRPPQRARETA